MLKVTEAINFNVQKMKRVYWYEKARGCDVLSADLSSS